MCSEFCNIQKDIFENIIEEVKKKFNFKSLERVIKMTNINRYNLVITGSIGAGKSTISQIMTYILKNYCKNTNIYPEYISTYFNNRPIGQDIFDMYMNHEITSSTFQNFILDIWRTLFEKNNYSFMTKEFTINIFERLPHDAVFCFSREQVGKTMTDEEYDIILQKYNQMKQDMNIPTYNTCKFKKICNDSNIIDVVVEILNIISGDLISDFDYDLTRVIGLQISNEKYKQRIQQRGRESEEKYCDYILEHYNEYYNELYKIIQKINLDNNLSSDC